MPPPDPIPDLKIGEVYYLKRVSVYHQCTLRSFHEFENTAKVSYYAYGEQLICRRSELITEEQYKAVLKQRAKEAYERDLPLRREQAKAKYAEVVAHWNTGRRTAKAMYESAKTFTVRGWAQRIVAAKRWKLIEDDARPPTN